MSNCTLKLLIKVKYVTVCYVSLLKGWENSNRVLKLINFNKINKLEMNYLAYF